MASTNETGHVRNIANYKQLISQCTSFGTKYSPTNANISITKLTEKGKTAQQKQEDVMNTNIAYKTAVYNASNAFEPLKKLATRTISAFAVSGANPLAIESAKSVNRVLQGYSARKKTSPENVASTNATTKTTSTSHQSREKLVEALGQLIAIYTQSPEYKPNEAELSVAGLKTILAALQDALEALRTPTINYNAALTARDRELYTAENSLTNLSKDVKTYIKSAYGTNSQEYKQISKLEIKKPSNAKI